jgi:hypothetical protein
MDPRVAKDVLDLLEGLKTHLKEPLGDILVQEVWSARSSKRSPRGTGSTGSMTSIFVTLELMRGGGRAGSAAAAAVRRKPRTVAAAATAALHPSQQPEQKQKHQPTETVAPATSATATGKKRKKKRTPKQKEKDRQRLLKFIEKKELAKTTSLGGPRKEKDSSAKVKAARGDNKKKGDVEAAAGVPAATTSGITLRKRRPKRQDKEPPCPYGLPPEWGLRYWGFEFRPETSFEQVFVRIAKDGQEELYRPHGFAPRGLEDFAHLLEDKSISVDLAARYGVEHWLQLRRQVNPDFQLGEFKSDVEFWKKLEQQQEN